MIIRVFRATPRPGHEADYERMIREESTKLVLSQKGLVALYTGAKVEPGHEIVMVSVWEDEESVAAFVGPQWHAPVVLHGETELVLQTEVANYQSL
ncbi:MAG TPA: antibiotic biosynthesis monooxygenase [Dermatophilaceae bacterium]